MLCASETVVAPSSIANAAMNIFKLMADLQLLLQPVSWHLVRPRTPEPVRGSHHVGPTAIGCGLGAASAEMVGAAVNTEACREGKLSRDFVAFLRAI